MIFHLSPSDCNSLQVFWFLLSILGDLSNAVIWMVSIHLPISISPSPFVKSLGIVLSALITIGITDTLMFHCLFSSLARFKYLSVSFFFCFFFLRGLIQWSARTAKSTTLQVLNFLFFFFFFFFLPIIIRSGLQAGIR